jgi:hypothetical protein
MCRVFGGVVVLVFICIPAQGRPGARMLPLPEFPSAQVAIP